LPKQNTTIALETARRLRVPFVFFDHQEIDRIPVDRLPFVQNPPGWRRLGEEVRTIWISSEEHVHAFRSCSKVMEDLANEVDMVWGAAIVATTPFGFEIGIFAREIPTPSVDIIDAEFCEIGEDPMQPLCAEDDDTKA
jgi:hypothetical protein